MKLKSTLTKNSAEVINTSIIAKNCSLAKAFDIIENWCNDNNANVPSRTSDVWKKDGKIQVSVTTKDHQFINIFDIED